MRICKKIATFVVTGAFVCTMSAIQVSSTATTQTRSYVRKTLNAGGNPVSTSTYSLSLSTENNGSPSPRIVTGTDDRYPDSNSSVVLITFESTQYGLTSTHTGTGFIIGDNTIVTAAHCLYNRDSKCYSSKVKVYLTDPDTGAVTIVTPTEYHVPQQYISGNFDSSFDYDYGLIVVNRDLYDYGTFTLGTIEEGLVHRNYIPINISGYPGDLQPSGTPTSQYQLYTGRDHLIYSDPYKIRCETDSYKGESGGPAYVSIEYQVANQTPYVKNTVVGIYVGDTPVDSNADGVIDFADDYQSCACRITAPMLQFFLNNPNVPDLF